MSLAVAIFEQLSWACYNIIVLNYVIGTVTGFSTVSAYITAARGNSSSPPSELIGAV